MHESLGCFTLRRLGSHAVFVATGTGVAQSIFVPKTRRNSCWRVARQIHVDDVGPTIEKKIDALLMNRAQGPAAEVGARLQASLRSRGLRLPVLGSDDTTANRNTSGRSC
jgi:hypothetical protein